MHNPTLNPQEKPQHIARRYTTLAQAREVAQDLAEVHEITKLLKKWFRNIDIINYREGLSDKLQYFTLSQYLC